MPVNWHLRFLQQAQWSFHIRHYLYKKARIEIAKRILEVGSGTGAILSEDIELGIGKRFGLDINSDYVKQSISYVPSACFTLGDAHHIPFPEHVFDITYCHYLLLWVKNPDAVVLEFKRVTRPGGFVIAMAEPDHEARLDYPDEFQLLGQLQTKMLHEQGADPVMGRKIGEIFKKSGFDQVEVGIIGAQWSSERSEDEFILEWNVLADDLRGKIGPDILKYFYKKERESLSKSYRILFVPTFYAIGSVV